jgi:hypothetical protein
LNTAGATRLVGGRAGGSAPQPTAGATRETPDVRLSKRQRIVILLQLYANARECLQRGDPGGSFANAAGSRFFQMPAAWSQGGFRELERCLLSLRDKSPRTYWAIRQRYLNRDGMFRARDREPSVLLVDLGIDWLVGNYHGALPSLPNDFYKLRKEAA